jgi:hypothetical protein
MHAEKQKQGQTAGPKYRFMINSAAVGYRRKAARSAG